MPMPKAITRVVTVHERTARALSLNEPTLPGWLLALAGVLAYTLGVYVRLGVAERSASKIANGPDGLPMFTTTDAYYYATGIEQALTGLLTGYKRVPDVYENVLVALGVVATKLGGISVARLGELLPVYMAPLFAGVVVLWGIALRMPRVGALAAFPAAVGYSYLNRTSPGQLDTDLVSLSAPCLALALVALALTRQQRPAALGAGLLCAISGYIHPGSERVLSVAGLTVALYVLLFRRDRLGALTALLYFLGLTAGPAWLRALCVCAAFVAERWSKVSYRALAVAALLAACVVVLKIAGGSYFSLLGQREDLTDTYRFYDVRSEVTELRAPPLNKMIERVAGNRWLLVAGVLGLGLLVLAEPLALPLVPLVLLGTFGALSSGLRFTIYAPLGLAMGAAYLFCALTDVARASLPKQQRGLLVVGAGLSLLALAAPAVAYGTGIDKASAFPVREARLMGELKGRVAPSSYVLTWWDHGYPLWYYTHARTLVDGAKQDSDLFVVAEALFGDSQLRSAQLSRLAVDVNRRSDETAIGDVFEEAKERGLGGDALLAKLGAPGYPLPPKVGEVYLFMPLRLAGIGTMFARGRRVGGLASREHIETGYLRSSSAPAGLTGTLKLTAGQLLNTKRWYVVTDTGKRPVASVITLRRGATGKIEPQGELKKQDAKNALHVLHLPERRLVVVVDEVMLRSVYVQLALFERADPRAFEPVLLRPEGAVYRVVP